MFGVERKDMRRRRSWMVLVEGGEVKLAERVRIAKAVSIFRQEIAGCKDLDSEGDEREFTGIRCESAILLRRG